MAIAVETSQTAAVRELLQEREHLAMEKEDLRSFLWQRHYIRAPGKAPTARPAEESETGVESEAESEAAPVGAATSMLLRSTADGMRHATDTLAWEMLDEDAGGRERSRSPRR